MRGVPRGIVWVFTLTSFLSAVLLFSVQPMFAKMALPVLGGSPSVWAVALCFFQGALLAGYGYAHALGRYIPIRIAGFVHLGLMLAAMLLLPIALPAGWREAPPDPYLWQFGLFAVGVGLPFLAVAANAPLLQSWFARTSHRSAGDPYFLYAASNLGSLMALLAYPFFLEPRFGLTALSHLWTWGFACLWAAIALCYLMSKRPEPGWGLSPLPSGGTDPVRAPVSWRDQLAWVGLAFVPAALLTAFTNHIATDVASAPLIWVIPLALYLLTFVFAFRERPIIWAPMALAIGAAAWRAIFLVNDYYADRVWHWVRWGTPAAAVAIFTVLYWFTRRLRGGWLSWAQLIAVTLALLQMSQSLPGSWFIQAGVGVAAFFFSALLAHRTLYETRPHATHLTQFYVFMSLGGVLGGLFSALVAPKLFAEVLEYPILLGLAVACQRATARFARPRTLAGGTAMALVGAAVIHWLPGMMATHNWHFNGYSATTAVASVFALFMLACFWLPAGRLVAALLMCVTVTALDSGVNHGDALAKRRSYFGVYRVSQEDEFNILTHGTTLHGAQHMRDAEGKPLEDYTPTTYYYPESPMGRTVATVRGALADRGLKGSYAVIGLGTGSLSCYAEEGEHWRFFEIDPVIIGISSDPKLFSFLTHCQPQPDIVLGDARLTMSKQPAGSFDLIIVDAFSSDAVPVHLLTKEAIAMYAEKLTPTGVVLLHTSNRYLDLDSVISATAPLVSGLHGVLLADASADDTYASNNSTVGVFSKSAAAIEPFKAMDESSDLDPHGMRPWTDDYSDLLAPFRARW